MGKKRIYVKVLAVVAAVFVIGGIIAKTVDKRRQMYYERISEMLDANWKYQHDLSIEGTLDLFSFDFNLDDVIIDYMMEKGKLKEMEKNEKG